MAQAAGPWVFNEVQWAFPPDIGKAAQFRFSTGAEILTALPARDPRVKLKGGGREGWAETYVPFSFAAGPLQAELRFSVVGHDAEDVMTRLARLAKEYLLACGYRVERVAVSRQQPGAGPRKKSLAAPPPPLPGSYTFEAVSSGGRPLYMSRRALYFHKLELFGALDVPQVRDYLANGSAAVSKDHRVFLAALIDSGQPQQIPLRVGWHSAPLMTHTAGRSATVLGPGAGVLGCSFVLPAEAPAVLQLSGKVRRVEVAPLTRGVGTSLLDDNFLSPPPRPPGVTDELESNAVGSLYEAYEKLPQTPGSPALSTLDAALALQLDGWQVTSSPGVVAFSREFFALPDGAVVPLAAEKMLLSGAVGKAWWALRLPHSDILPVTRAFLEAAASQILLGQLPLCTLSGRWLGMEMRVEGGEAAFVLPPDPVLRPGLPKSRQGLGRAEADFDADLRVALLFPLVSAYFLLFPERTGHFRELKVRRDLRVVAPLASYSEAKRLVAAIEDALAAPNLRLKMKAVAGEEEGLELRWELLRGGAPSFYFSDAELHSARGETDPSRLPLSAVAYTTSPSQPAAGLGGAGGQGPETSDGRDLRGALLRHLKSCHDQEDPVTYQRFQDMSTPELAKVVMLDVGGARYCFQAETLTQLSRALDPLRRRPLSFEELARAYYADLGAAGLFDVGPLKGLMRGPAEDHRQVPGRVLQEISKQGVLVKAEVSLPLPSAVRPSSLRFDLLEVLPARSARLERETVALLGRAWRRGLFLSDWGAARLRCGLGPEEAASEEAGSEEAGSEEVGSEEVGSEEARSGQGTKSAAARGRDLPYFRMGQEWLSASWLPRTEDAMAAALRGAMPAPGVE